ncbi:MAG: hypothetical protein ABFS37_14070, partial [Acidobacteriota bacterium]
MPDLAPRGDTLGNRVSAHAVNAEVVFRRGGLLPGSKPAAPPENAPSGAAKRTRRPGLGFRGRDSDSDSVRLQVQIQRQGSASEPEKR